MTEYASNSQYKKLLRLLHSTPKGKVAFDEFVTEQVEKEVYHTFIATLTQLPHG